MACLRSALGGLATAALMALFSGGAQAGLFDDEEARKAILDLRARIQASDDGAQSRLADQAKGLLVGALIGLPLIRTCQLLRAAGAVLP